MSNPIKLKTLLLALAVVLITFTIFIALPVTIPPLSQLNCRGFWCSANVVIYHTWIWDKPEQPDQDSIKNILLRLNETDGLRLVGYKGPAGKLNFALDSDNENCIIVSGYLQYGDVIESENSSEKIISKYPMLEGYLKNSIVTIKVVEYYENSAEETSYELTTDSKGFFNVEINLGQDLHCYRISADYIGEIITTRDLTVDYLPCWVTYSTCEIGVVDRHGIPWWVWLILSITIIVGGWFIYRYLKRRRKIEIPLKILPPAEEFEIPVTEEAEESESGGDIARFNISFPEIAENFPAVWGANEPLAVNINLIDDIVSSQICEVEWGDGDRDQEIAGENDRCSLSHTFTNKGEYTIMVSCKNSRSKKDISSWRRIRIVDYREEIVRLFNDMLDTMDIEDIRIDPEMTPREIEEMLHSRFEGISESTLSRLISGFEEANYSIHPVTRDSYVAMYRAIREVIGSNI